MLGEKISRYRVLEKLGEGGMGDVYLAMDESLERRVALKFLKDEITQKPGFGNMILSEARAVAAVDHPFVCKVYEASDAATRPYIALEYVEGVTLRQRLAEGAISIETALKFANEIAEALMEVHARGIVHHDIKPGNIMLTQHGHVKLMDFGLARKLPGRKAAATSPDSTSTVAMPVQMPVFGTPSYMAPEQLRGDTSDLRADIFALGLVLYEMVTGKHPFLKDSVAATAWSILFDEYPPLPSSVPGGLGETIARALKKNAIDRHQTMEELKVSLQTALDPASASSAPSQQTVAVLPFSDLSPQQDQAYFCDGLAEEVLISLTQVERLRVISRTSSFRFRGSQLDITEIGRQLGASAILEGSVRKGTDQVRITVTLTNVRDGFPLWSERYDCRMIDVLSIQEAISQAIVERLKASLVSTHQQSSTNPEAYEQYLRAKFCWNQRTPAGLRESVEHYKKAVSIDPFYARPYAGLAVSHVTLSIYGVVPPDAAMAHARKSAEDALKRDPKQADALAALGCVSSVFDWKWEESEKYFKQAIALDSKNVLARQWYAINLLAPLGRFDDAEQQIEHALQIDPASPIVHATAGLNYYFARRYPRALESLTKALQLDSSLGIIHYFIAQVHLARSHAGKAIEELETAVRLSNRDSESIALLAFAQAVAGNRSGALDLFEELQQRSKNGYLSPVLLAQVSLGLGDQESVFRLLEQAFKLRTTDLIWLGIRPFFDGLRADPRFLELCLRIGFPPPSCGI
ncbi:MAG: protein kinase [Acidobacteria bacterium]|nr:protein kinase [Acidobacteriota bacterium]